MATAAVRGEDPSTVIISAYLQSFGVVFVLERDGEGQATQGVTLTLLLILTLIGRLGSGNSGHRALLQAWSAVHRIREGRLTRRYGW